jgi:hypothetical protein
LAILNKENYPESSATHFSYISCTVSFTPVPAFDLLFQFLFPALAPLLPLLFLSIICCYLSYSSKCSLLYSADASRENLLTAPFLFLHFLSFSLSYSRTCLLILSYSYTFSLSLFPIPELVY